LHSWIGKSVKECRNIDAKAATVVPALESPPSVGQPAPRFSLPSLSGAEVDLASYRGRSNVIIWFSRGFTCPFCRIYTDSVRAGYAALQDADTEVIQVAPNLLESARRYFSDEILPFPFVCDRTSGSTRSTGWAIGGRSRRPAPRW